MFCKVTLGACREVPSHGPLHGPGRHASRRVLDFASAFSSRADLVISCLVRTRYSAAPERVSVCRSVSLVSAAVFVVPLFLHVLQSNTRSLSRSERLKVLKGFDEKRSREKVAGEKVARKGRGRKGGNTRKGGRRRFQTVAIAPFCLQAATRRL